MQLSILPNNARIKEPAWDGNKPTRKMKSMETNKLEGTEGKNIMHDFRLESKIY